MGLEKSFKVEIDGQDYTIELDNLAVIKFEQMVEMPWFEWGMEYLSNDKGENRWQPSMNDGLKLLVCALRKHQPRKKFTVESLAEIVTIEDMYAGDLAAKLFACWIALYPEAKDIDQVKPDSEEVPKEDPLEENPPDGGT